MPWYANEAVVVEAPKYAGHGREKIKRSKDSVQEFHVHAYANEGSFFLEISNRK